MIRDGIGEHTSEENSKKAAIYCRLSDEDRNKKNPFEDSRSIQTQKNMLIDYAIKQGWEIYNIFSDDDWSGADGDRPDYNKLLEEAEQRKFGIVLCKHQSRFTRDMEHVERYIHDKFKEWNIRFVSILDGADTELRGNKKSRQINGLVNEWYLEDLSENVKAAFKTRKAAGKYISSSVPYGYIKDPKDINHLIVDEMAAETVRMIFAMYLKGNSQENIAKQLNEQGVLCPTRYKREVLNLNVSDNLASKTNLPIWRSSVICQILSNEVYLGHSLQNRSESVSYKNHTRIKLPREKWITVRNTHEAIVLQEDFDAVEKLRKTRTRPMKRGKVALFSGILRCGYCGSRLILNSTKGNGYAYYRCMKREVNGKKHSCCVNEKLLIRAVNRELRGYIDDLIQPGIMVQKIEIANKADKRREDWGKALHGLKERCNAIDKTVMNLYEDKIKGLLSEEQFLRMNETCQKERESLSARIEVQTIRCRELKMQEEREIYVQEGGETLEELNRYLEFKELTRGDINELISTIEVLNGMKWGEKRFKIYWKF